MKKIIMTVLILALLLSVSPAMAAGQPYLEINQDVQAAGNAMVHAYLSDPAIKDIFGVLHLGICNLGPHDGYYYRSLDDGATWTGAKNITNERTASKGGSIYINNQTGKGLYMGFFNVSGYNLNSTNDYGNNWTTGAYRFIPGSTNGLTGYIYPIGSVYDGANTVYAMQWGSKYHSGNGKIGVSKTTNLGTSWTNLAGAANTNTLILGSNDLYAIDSADLLLDSSGNMYAFYIAYDNTGKWNLKVYNGSDGTRQIIDSNLNYSRFGSTALSAWLDNDGQSIHIAYVAETGPNEKSQLMYSCKDSLGNWSSPVVIGTDGISRRPAFMSGTMDEEGNSYAVWNTYDGNISKMFYSILPDSAAEWTSPSQLFSDVQNLSAYTGVIKSIGNKTIEMVYSRTIGAARSVNYAKLTLKGANADTIPPTAEVIYSTASPTNADVTASIIPSEPVTITNNGGADTYTFTENGTFTFEFSDAAGNTGTAAATVANIDKTAPSAEVIYSITSPTNEDVTVTIIPSEPVTITNNGGSDTYTFAENGTFTFEFSDAAGNTGTAAATVANIDKTAPVLSVKVDKPVINIRNHKMEEINVILEYFDDGSGISCVELVSIESNEPDNGIGDGNTTEDIQGAEYGEEDTVFELRAERTGGGGDRVYTITYRATDSAGNSVLAQATVTIPHDNSASSENAGKGKKK